MIYRKGLWISVIAIELVAGAAWLGSFWPQQQSAPAALPLADTATLDSLASSEIESAYQLATRLRDAESLRALAEVYVVNGFFPEAEFCGRRATEIEPNNYDVRFLWAVALDRLGLVEEAAEQFSIARSIAPDRYKGECSYLVGRNSLRNNDIEQAEQAFREGADSHVPAKYELARLLVSQERFADAKLVLDELLDSYPNSLRILQQRARVADAFGNDELAAELRDRAERGEEVIASDHLVLDLLLLSKNHGLSKVLDTAQDFARQNEFNRAAQEYRRALKIHWKPDTAWKLALAEMDMGNWEQAENFIEELIARGGETAERLDLLGTAYMRLSEKTNDQSIEDKAVETWQRATKYTGPSNVHLKLAQYYGDQDNAELRDQHLASAHHSKGVELFRSNNLQLASREFAEAIKLDPERAHSWYYVGELARAGNHRETAIRAYERCLRLQPHHGRAAAQLARLQAGA